MAAIPQLIAGRYRVVREIGRGGMGVVYLVSHVNTGAHHALKLLLAKTDSDAEAIERFKREMRAPARIRSENVVIITDADVAPELGGVPFLVMELLDGCNLETLLSNRRLAFDEVVWILAQVARALDKAHAAGIVHRDLKPENLFLHRREDGGLIVKILDFGIAKVARSAGPSLVGAGSTTTGAFLGTPLYMSPEQVLGDTPAIGPATDVWAVGMVAFRLLTKQAFWAARSIPELIARIMRAEMPRASERCPELPPAFDDWFARACAHRPEQRWPTVGEQVVQLAKALGVAVSPIAPETLGATQLAAPVALTATLDSTVGPVAVTRTVTAAQRRRRPLVLAIAVAVASSTAAAVWLASSRDHRPPPTGIADASLRSDAVPRPSPAAPPPMAPPPPPKVESAAPRTEAKKAVGKKRHPSKAGKQRYEPEAP